jgi:sugar phosphate isomerase/epimerase
MQSATLAGMGMMSEPVLHAAEQAGSRSPVRFCLNTSTIRGQNLTLEQAVDLVADCGYDGIEPWVREIEAHRDAGKSVSDLAKRIADRGLKVESAIGFAPWIVNDDAQRQAGLEQLRRDMDLVRQLGGTRLAAPPIGMQKPEHDLVPLPVAAERYAAAVRIGRDAGVVPMVEVWGFSRNLSRLGESVFVAIECGEPEACLLPDVYHIYKGGSAFEGLHMLGANAIPCFHFNDYPAQPGRAEIDDSYRVFPGEGVAPWPVIMQTLRQIGFCGVASLELFNREYWKRDAKEVATIGLQKMKALFARYGW